MPPLRLMIVMPSWVGDAVMATPALRLVRSRLPGIYIGGLVRPGIDELLAGTDFFDEVHADRPAGVMGYKHIAARLRARRYDTALLFTNSFSTALIARLAGVPRRIGYNRDARRLLLTDLLDAPKRPDGRWAPIPAAAYYWHAAQYLLDPNVPRRPEPVLPGDITPMQLAITPQECEAAAQILQQANLQATEPFCILNPGGNNPAKRWPVDRFAAVARHLHSRYGMRVLINGAPAEADLVGQLAQQIAECGHSGGGDIGMPPVSLPELGITLGSLKGVLADSRCRLMVTNDTGPRHIAAAFGVPVVALFGPTDPRWTTIPVAREEVVTADPALPPEEVADDHPERCRIDRIETQTVIAAVERVLADQP